MIDRPVHHSKTRRDAPPGNIDIAIGDFFDLDANVVTKPGRRRSFDACWDRAALVAIHPKDRKKYVDTVHKMLRPGGHVLLVVTEHDPFPHGVLGPPFSIPEKTVRELYEADERFEVEVLERRSRLEEGIAKRANLNFFDEVAYLIRRK
jgi:thiopurine S-methyltransferase